jgi:transcriptional regulator with XRE-family HTH domain
MAIAEQIGERIREIRRAKGMTQAALAEATGRTEDSVSQIERGLNLPTIDTVLALARALTVPVDHIISSPELRKVDAEKKSELAEASLMLATMSPRDLTLAVKLLRVIAENATAESP